MAAAAMLNNRKNCYTSATKFGTVMHLGPLGCICKEKFQTFKNLR